jgi:hypothetical protein
MNLLTYGGLALALAASALNVAGSIGFGMFLFAFLNLHLLFSLVAFVGCVIALAGVALAAKPKPEGVA